MRLHKLTQHASKEEKSKSKYYCESCDQVFFSSFLHDSHINGTKHKNRIIINMKKI